MQLLMVGWCVVLIQVLVVQLCRRRLCWEEAPRAALLQELEVVVEALDVGHHPTCLVFWDGWDPGLGMGAGSPFEGGGVCSCSPVDSPQVIQPPPKPGALIRPPQVTLTQTPMVALRQPHNRIVLTTPQQIQLNQLQPVPVVKPAVLPGTKALSTVSAQAAAAQKNKLKEPGGGSFRDDDDINDVASMAGVNLSEESARILATNSELVGTLTRSCKDETFLLPAPLQRRILEIGTALGWKKHGITELHPDVVSYVSHATQQRLQNLVEKISETAQQKNFSYKDDDRYEQASDVRAQLKFFEQLDQIEKQRKDEQEREILMRAAKASACGSLSFPISILRAHTHARGVWGPERAHTHSGIQEPERSYSCLGCLGA
ncbi:hypothetical protein Celaphus_00007774 [Cervus elaphus hippelaphus]|uniref:Transcription initiation factor TFIID component TAF4 C-terminal domain-containing protein n=1 Tax=Cervus elaphus hippelaphus TaxID=46360 RepID=A0A212CAC9_CEREH|nr:hypothetical protein Celaphus_00007774 [Cervus elaphus hippelaphus]